MGIPEYLLILLLLLYFVTLPKIFAAAGQDSWKGYVPVYQYLVWLKIIKRPWWWLLLLLVPGVNLLMLTIMNVELSIVFNKRKTSEQWIAGILPWYFIIQLAFLEKSHEYVGPRDWKVRKKSMLREWGEAAVFAIVAASVIRTFILEAFTIPTPSMEGTMLVGDFLFVSKMSYGPKIPQTPMSIPFIHNTIPKTNANSYVEWFNLPYLRLPGFGDVERNDPVVFNFPHGDTVIVHPFYQTHDYYKLVREQAVLLAGNNYAAYEKSPETYKKQARELMEKGECPACTYRGEQNGIYIDGIRQRPVDKRENYVKRCVAIAGDEFEIRDRVIYINGEATEAPEYVQFSYAIYGNRNDINWDKLKQSNHLNQGDLVPSPDKRNARGQLNPEEVQKFESFAFIDSVVVINEALAASNRGEIFPNSPLEPYRHWTKDNFGPIRIPAKGDVLDLNEQTLPLFRRLIEVYEGNEMSVSGGEIRINGEVTSSYEVKQNYYWMMGDNRHASLDSRYWGYVPEDHVVGKPLFIWFSKDNEEYYYSNSVRWDRMFQGVD